MSKEEIMNEYVRICNVGSLRELGNIIAEAKEYGITQQELRDYSKRVS